MKGFDFILFISTIVLGVACRRNIQVKKCGLNSAIDNTTSKKPWSTLLKVLKWFKFIVHTKIYIIFTTQVYSRDIRLSGTAYKQFAKRLIKIFNTVFKGWTLIILSSPIYFWVTSLHIWWNSCVMFNLFQCFSSLLLYYGILTPSWFRYPKETELLLEIVKFLC